MERSVPKEIMVRHASDNEYLHKDFHGALSAGLEYLHERYGEESVREYLRQFTKAFYAPLIRKLKESGLGVLKEYYEKKYEIEGGEAAFSFTSDELVISAKFCPAVMHMKKHGYPVARLFHETTKTVNEALCDGTEYAAELVEYDAETGRSVQRFFRRQK